MQVSQMMKALESKGWVKRVRSASDFRAKNIVLSPEGLAVLHRAFPPMIELQRNLFGEDGAPGGRLIDALHRAESSAPDA
jgi:DNA-binding MarR family transcriptional regulator